MAVNVSQTISATFGTMTVAELRDFLAAIEKAGAKDDDRVSVDHWKGDLRDPSTTTLRVTVRTRP